MELACGKQNSLNLILSALFHALAHSLEPALAREATLALKREARGFWSIARGVRVS